jgi:hypothetical protein
MQKDIAQKDSERKREKRKTFDKESLPQIRPEISFHKGATCPPAGLPFQIKS